MPGFESLSPKNVEIALGSRTLLTGLSFTIKTREKVLLTAPSGLGKTTLLRVLQGTLSVKKGEYLINQKASALYDPIEVRKQFGWIRQTPFLFENTLRFNLILDKPYGGAELLKVLDNVGLRELAEERGLDF